MQKPTLFFAVLMAMALSSSAAEVKAEPKMDNLMDRITKLNDHALPVNAVPAELAAPVEKEEDHEKRGYSDSFHQIGSGLSDLGGNLKNSTVDLWQKMTAKQSEEEEAKEKADQEKADQLKFIQKRGRNAPKPVKARPAPVRPKKQANRNKNKTSTVPLEKVHFKGAKRSPPTIERRAALWEHVQKVAAARSKRELHALHQEAKRNDIWEDLPHLVAKRSQAQPERRALWEHVQKVAAATSKRELSALHREAKRSAIWEDLPQLVAKRSTNSKKRSLEDQSPQLLGGQNATFSGPGLSGVAGNGTVTLTFNSTEVKLSLVNGTIAASAPLAVTTIQAAADQLNNTPAAQLADDVEVVPAPAGLDTSIHTEIIKPTQDAHIASLAGVEALNGETPTFVPNIPTLPAQKVKRTGFFGW